MIPENCPESDYRQRLHVDWRLFAKWWLPQLNSFGTKRFWVQLYFWSKVSTSLGHLVCIYYIVIYLFQATTVRKEWPSWCHFVIAFLILMAAIWIPLVAILKLFGIHLLSEEEPSWFPADELRDFHGLMPHKVSAIEKCLFCIKEDEPEEMWWGKKRYAPSSICNLASEVCWRKKKGFGAETPQIKGSLVCIKAQF